MTSTQHLEWHLRVKFGIFAQGLLSVPQIPLCSAGMSIKCVQVESYKTLCLDIESNLAEQRTCKPEQSSRI